MNMKELSVELKKIGLSLVWDVNRQMLSVGNPKFANPLVWFNPHEENYSGTVQVKSINVPLFSENQIKQALQLVDKFLHTPLDKRDLPTMSKI